VPLAYSIVVPTHDRREILPEVLDALEAQEGATFEIVLVDDGSSDGTRELLAGRRFRVPARVLTQENLGPARARNAGVRAASGKRVAFLGDDTVPVPGWLAVHHRAWSERGGEEGVAVLGYTAWHPRMRRTPFLDYINEHGLQFGYALISDPEDVPFNFFYTSNISLSRALLLAEPFHEGFPYPAWEDIELAYRLRRRGLRIVYEPRARVHHDHPTDLDRFGRRQERAGYSAVVFHRLHPELGPFLGLGPKGPPPVPSSRRQRSLEALVRALQPLRLATPRLWQAVLRYHYIRGLRRAWAEAGEAKGDTR